MALDHSTEIRPGKQIRPNFLRSTSLLYKILPTSRETNLLYFLYITSEMKQHHEALFLSYRPRCSMQYFTILQYKFQSFNIQDDRSTRGLLAKPLKKIPKAPIRLASTHDQRVPLVRKVTGMSSLPVKTG